MTMVSHVLSEDGLGLPHDLGPIDRIPLGEGRRYLVGTHAIAVFRLRSGEVYATQAECPHRAGPLEDGVIGGSTLVCPLHAYRFSLATGACLDDGCGNLRTYPVQVKEGRIVISVPAF